MITILRVTGMLTRDNRQKIFDGKRGQFSSHEPPSELPLEFFNIDAKRTKWTIVVDDCSMTAAQVAAASSTNVLLIQGYMLCRVHQCNK
eukprot:scaffold65566_cov18-Prasinocladus_malaysianus.AAC.1